MRLSSFENVFGFVYKPHQPAFDYLKEKAEEYGYDITYKVVNTANYGVPQTRERFLCVGVRRDFGKKFIFPIETHYNPEKIKSEDCEGKSPWVTCGQAIGDLDCNTDKFQFVELIYGAVGLRDNLCPPSLSRTSTTSSPLAPWMPHIFYRKKTGKQGMWRATCEKRPASLSRFHACWGIPQSPKHTEFFCGCAPFWCFTFLAKSSKIKKSLLM